MWGIMLFPSTYVVGDMDKPSGSQVQEESGASNGPTGGGKFKNPGKILIVTNVPEKVFNDDSCKVYFAYLYNT